MISIEGNNGGDVLRIKELPDGRIRLVVDHACTNVINAVVPVEFVTSILSRVVLDSGGLVEAVEQTNWSAEYKAHLVSQITSD